MTAKVVTNVATVGPKNAVVKMNAVDIAVNKERTKRSFFYLTVTIHLVLRLYI